jgi:hypothetical protein
MRYPIPPKVLAVVEIFDTLPDVALVSYLVAEVVTGLSTKTLRNHPQLTKIRPSRKRECPTVGSLRQIMRGEAVA